MPAGVLVLLYHRVLPVVGRDFNQLAVSTANFAAQLAWLMRHTEVLDESTFLEYLDGAPPQRVGRSRPRVLLTFDDGYADNWRHAAPLLRRAGCSALLFVTSRLLDHDAPFWWDALEQLLFAPHRPRAWRLPEYPAGLPAQPAESAYQALHPLLRPLRWAERESRLAQLAEQAGFTPATDADSRPLTWTELRAWRAAGLSVGAHTRTHPVLAALDDAALTEEIGGSVADLSRGLGAPVRTFSYPFGGRRDFDDRAARCVATAGVRAAFANIPGMVSPTVDPYRIPRCLVRNWAATEFGSQFSNWIAARR